MPPVIPIILAMVATSLSDSEDRDEYRVAQLSQAATSSTGLSGLPIDLQKCIVPSSPQSIAVRVEWSIPSFQFKLQNFYNLLTFLKLHGFRLAAGESRPPKSFIYIDIAQSNDQGSAPAKMV